jgi:hypothetical protein
MVLLIKNNYISQASDNDLYKYDNVIEGYGYKPVRAERRRRFVLTRENLNFLTSLGFKLLQHNESPKPLRKN